MAEFRIQVVVDPSGAVGAVGTVNRELDKTGRRAERTRRLLRSVFAGIGVGIAIREYTRLADSYTVINNRLKLVTSSQSELVAVQRELVGIAQRTRTQYTATAQVYSRTALAANNLGIAQKDLLQFTESVNQAVILSGATTRESNAALIQLSQGIASNTLRGDELRAVLEQLPLVADTIAKSIGVTRGEIRDLAAQGLITAETIIRAFDEAEDELRSLYEQTIPTIGQSLNVLINHVTLFVGTFNEASEAGLAFNRLVNSLGAVMDALSENIGVVVLAVKLLVAELFALLAIRVVSFFASLTARVAGAAAAHLELVSAVRGGRATLLNDVEITKARTAHTLDLANAQRRASSERIGQLQREQGQLRSIIADQREAVATARASLDDVERRRQRAALRGVAAGGTTEQQNAARGHLITLDKDISQARQELTRQTVALNRIETQLHGTTADLNREQAASRAAVTGHTAAVEAHNKAVARADTLSAKFARGFPDWRQCSTRPRSP